MVTANDEINNSKSSPIIWRYEQASRTNRAFLPPSSLPGVASSKILTCAMYCSSRAPEGLRFEKQDAIMRCLISSAIDSLKKVEWVGPSECREAGRKQEVISLCHLVSHPFSAWNKSRIRILFSCIISRDNVTTNYSTEIMGCM
jgi:hypothetical protein